MYLPREAVYGLYQKKKKKKKERKKKKTKFIKGQIDLFGNYPGNQRIFLIFLLHNILQH